MTDKPTVESIRSHYTTSEDWEWLKVLLDRIDELERKLGIDVVIAATDEIRLTNTKLENLIRIMKE